MLTTCTLDPVVSTFAIITNNNETLFFLYIVSRRIQATPDSALKEFHIITVCAWVFQMTLWNPFIIDNTIHKYLRLLLKYINAQFVFFFPLNDNKWLFSLMKLNFPLIKDTNETSVYCPMLWQAFASCNGTPDQSEAWRKTIHGCTWNSSKKYLLDKICNQNGLLQALSPRWRSCHWDTSCSVY